MFGPDRCGETNKVHFIMRHQNPISKEWEEKHLVSPPVPETNDKLTHLYTAVVGTDNTVKILVDNVEKKSVRRLLTHRGLDAAHSHSAVHESRSSPDHKPLPAC